jgi:hypothetical protein
MFLRDLEKLRNARSEEQGMDKMSASKYVLPDKEGEDVDEM